MGQLVDVVPNHMGISRGRNAWWQDVLENGAASRFASFFDIDWEPLKPELRNRVLLPILEDHYGRVLESQGLRLQYEDGAFLIRYRDAVLPVSPCSYPQILTGRLAELEGMLGRDDPRVQELRDIAAAAERLPARTETEPERQAERAREKEIVKRRLDTLTREAPAVKAFVEEALWLFNGVPGQPESFDRLDALLGAQAYRVAYWGVAGDEINYRRFFDVNDLAAIRMEDPAVFEAAHGLLLRLIHEGRITGLRIDHPDGLYAPARYLSALQERAGREPSRHARRRAGSSSLLRGGREGAPAGGVAAGPLAGPRHHRVRAPERPERALRGREGSAGARANVRAVHGADRRLRRHRPRGEAARHRHDDGKRAERARPASRTPGGAAPRVPRLHGTEPDGGPARDGRVLPRVPDLRRRRRPGGQRARPRARGGGRGGGQAPQPHHEPLGLRLHRRPPLPHRGAGLRAEVPAAHRPGHRQGRRGHRLLPVPPPALAERGGRRSRPLRHVRGGVPPAERGATGPVAPLAVGHRRPTTRSGARTSGRGSTCSRRSRSSGAPTSARGTA